MSDPLTGFVIEFIKQNGLAGGLIIWLVSKELRLWKANRNYRNDGKDRRKIEPITADNPHITSETYSAEKAEIYKKVGYNKNEITILNGKVERIEDSLYGMDLKLNNIRDSVRDLARAHPEENITPVK